MSKDVCGGGARDGREGFQKKEVSVTKHQILIVLIFVKMGELLALKKAKPNSNTNREMRTSSIAP